MDYAFYTQVHAKMTEFTTAQHGNNRVVQQAFFKQLL